MNDFLDRAETLLHAGDAKAYQDDFERVFRGVAQLNAIFARAHLETWNVETVFSTFEMGSLIGRLGAIEGDDARRLPPAP